MFEKSFTLRLWFLDIKVSPVKKDTLGKRYLAAFLNHKKVFKF